MKKKYVLLLLVISVVFVSGFSGCQSSYNGPYADMPLITKDMVKKQIDLDNAIIKNSKETLINQVKAKQDIKYYQMLLSCYTYYEDNIKKIDGKKYMISGKSVKQFITQKKYETDLKMIDTDSKRWPAIFLGNMARYFDSIGFTIGVDGSLGEENIVLSW